MSTTIAQPTTQTTPLRTLALLFLVLVAAVAFALPNEKYPYVPWLLGITFSSLALLPNSRAWPLASILIAELSLSSYTVAEVGMSLRFLVVVASLGVSLPIVLRRRELAHRKMLRRVLVPSIALVVLATGVNLLTSESEYVIQYLRYQSVQVLGLAVAAAVVSSRQDLKRIALVALTIGLVAAVASLWQHFATQTAIYGNATPEAVKGWKGRTIGLSDSPVIFAHQMTFVLMPLLGVLVTGPIRRDRTRMLLCGAVVLLAAGLNFSYTRSAVFAIGPGLILMGLYLKGRLRAVLLGSVVAAFVLFQLLEGTGLIGSRYYKDASEDRSAASHEALWDVGLAVALDNAVLGIGHEHFEAVSVEYLDALAEDPDSVGGSGSVGQERPHNDWLSVWISWGILALVAYVALFIGILRNLAVAAGSSDPLIRGLAVGGAGALATYAVNSAYHNYMDSNILLWIFAGLSAALARLSSSKQAASGKAWSNRVYPSRGVARPSVGGLFGERYV